MGGMSTQIRKALGYALTDVVENDPRINWESPLLDCPTAQSLAAFADHLGAIPARQFSALDNAAEEVRDLARSKPRWRLDDCVVYRAVEGSPQVMVIVPPSCADEWLRSDDIFDYVEAHFGDVPDMEPIVKEVSTGIYPYDGLWMDKQTGVELQKVSLFRNILQSGKATPERLLAAAHKISPLPDLDEDARAEKHALEPEPLFGDADEAAARLVRLVPAEVRELAAFGKLFTDEGTWTSLVPVHYTYWS